MCSNNNNNKEGRRKFWDLMGMFIASIVFLVSWSYTYLQTQAVYIKYVQHFVCRSYLNKVVKKVEEFSLTKTMVLVFCREALWWISIGTASWQTGPIRYIYQPSLHCICQQNSYWSFVQAGRINHEWPKSVSILS